MDQEKFCFDEPLLEGIIKSRPNRFIMIVDIAGKVQKAHCPTTGRIGNVVFKDVPCLLSKSANRERKTPYTVEAICLDRASGKNRTWIGINQTRINKYIEYFISHEKLPLLINDGGHIKRERVLGKSRIDFEVDGTFIEVKMPLIHLPSDGTLSSKKMSKFNSFDRTIKHFGELARDIKKKGNGARAVLLMCYMYDAKPFVPPPIDKDNVRIHRAVRKAIAGGVENWQVNLKIDKKGVALLKYFRLKM